MKKTLPLLLVIIILSTMIFTAFASPIMNGSTTVVADAPAGIIADVVEKENTVEITAKLKGVVNLTAASIVISYNSAKVSIADVATKTSYTGAILGTSATVAPYVENLASVTYLSGWNMYINKIDPVNTTKYFAVGYAQNTGSAISLADGATASLFKVYFNKLAGQDVVASDFNFFKVTVNQSKLTNGAVNILQGTGTDTSTIFYRPDRFSLTFINYSDGLLSEDGTTTVYNLELLNQPLVHNTYTISYVANGGNSIADLNGVISLPNPLPIPVHVVLCYIGADNYHFDGWYMDSNFTVRAVAGTQIFANTTLYAKWKVVKYAPPLEKRIEYNVPAKIKNEHGQIVEAILPSSFVVYIPGNVPAAVTETNINDNEFGVIFGGVKFKSLATWEGLNLNQGKYFIKLVDPTGILTGKTFKAKTYFGSQISSQEIDVTID